MKKLILGIFAVGLFTHVYAQDPTTVELPEVTIVNTNYKYINMTGSEDLAIPVENLQAQVANFDVKKLDIYEDEYDYYDVYFVIPEGRILASYDKDGNILRTAEKFKGMDLPVPVIKSVLKRFPNWNITKETYLVHYHEPNNIKKMYKLTLKNGDKLIKVKLDDDGFFYRH